MATLKDVLPYEFTRGEFSDTKAFKFADCLVVAEHEHGWIGPQKNVHVWYELDNGYAVGWNESPSVGWSFPVVKIKR